MFKKIICIALVFAGCVLPASTLAQTQSSDEVFEAKVIRILEEREFALPDGSRKTQQNLRLKAIDGQWEGKEIISRGISDLEVASGNAYKVGDNVLLNRVQVDGEENFYVIDYVRRAPLFWLALIFSCVILAIGRKRGFRALLGLLLSFVIIFKFILPRILNGSSPIAVSLFGAFTILVIMIYLTEGMKRKSHVAAASVFLSLSVTLFLSWLFTNLTRLTGMVGDDAMALMSSSGKEIDFQGLLLAGIIIGAVGVLDDVIVGQVEAVEQIREANPGLSTAQIFKHSYKIGNAHLGAIVNTLFLTYAGASLPVLLLFSLEQGQGLTFFQAINNELVATEVVRTLVGSIGVAMSLPISTWLAAKFLVKK